MREGGGFHYVIVDSTGRAGTGSPGAAVHRHILDRMNAINDSF